MTEKLFVIAIIYALKSRLCGIFKTGYGLLKMFCIFRIWGFEKVHYPIGYTTKNKSRHLIMPAFMEINLAY